MKLNPFKDAGLPATFYDWLDRLVNLFIDWQDAEEDLATTGTITGEMLLQSDTWHAYGGFQDQAETITIGVTDTWYHVTNATNDLWTGLEADGITLSGDVMTFTNAADYIGSVTISVSALANKDYQLRLYNITQAAAAGYHIDITTSGANNYTDISMPLYIEADAGDEFRIEIRCTTSATNVVANSAVFYVSYLHS